MVGYDGYDVKDKVGGAEVGYGYGIWLTGDYEYDGGDILSMYILLS